MDGPAAVQDLLAHLVRHLGVKLHQHLVDDIQGVLRGGELIGVREQIPLQPVVVPQLDVLEEGEGVVVVGGHILEVLHTGHVPLLQQGEDLVDGIALRDGDGDGGFAGGIGAHAGEQGPVVHVGVQGEGARHHLILAPGKGGKQIKQRLVLNESVFLEHVRHIAKAVFTGNGNGNRFLLFVQGQHIVGGHPADTGQQGGNSDDKHHIEQSKARRGAAFFPAAAILSRPGPSGSAGSALRLIAGSALFLCHRVSS